MISYKHLGNNDLPELTETVIQSMNKPFMLTEFQQALSHMKSGKSPGPEGLTTLYYKTFSNHLAPYFLCAFNSVTNKGQISQHLLEMNVTVDP